jgi:hypothetical protein
LEIRISLQKLRKMGLNCLLLTSDVRLFKAIRNTFEGTSVELEMRTDAPAAIELSGRRHLDGFVIDCDDVPGAAGVIGDLRNGRSNKSSIVFAVCERHAYKHGALGTSNRAFLSSQKRGPLRLPLGSVPSLPLISKHPPGW